MKVRRAQLKQLNVRLSDISWKRLDQLQQHLGHLPASSMIELLIHDKYKAERLHLTAPQEQPA